MASSFTSFRDHTQPRATVGMTPLDEWAARRRDLYLTTHTTDKHLWPRWDSNPRSSRRAVVHLRIRPRGHWDRRSTDNTILITRAHGKKTCRWKSKWKTETRVAERYRKKRSKCSKYTVTFAWHNDEDSANTSTNATCKTRRPSFVTDCLFQTSWYFSINKQGLRWIRQLNAAGRSKYWKLFIRYF
jgi:hypothetical protein